MKEFKDVGALVKCARVVGVSCKLDSADSCRLVVESDGSVTLLEDSLEFFAVGWRASDVPSVINMYVKSEGIGGVDRAALMKAVVV